MRLPFTVLFLFISLSCISQTVERQILFSREVNDSFQIIIKHPANADGKKRHIYVPDGSLKLGNYILGTDPSWAATVPDDCIVIAIAHLGDWSEKRRRDFIPSDAGGYHDAKFGNALSFYHFLEKELIPWVNQKFGMPAERAFIGHSFSGLFCLYTLFQHDKLFNRHFALSPSIWANDEELLKIEKDFASRNKALNAEVVIHAGGLEVFNKVLSSVRKFVIITSERDYSNLKMESTTTGNANHYSVIKPGVDLVMKKLQN